MMDKASFPPSVFEPDSGTSDGFYAERRNVIRQDIATRLRKICANYPEAEFAKLVDEMTTRQLRFERGGQLPK